jgi:hypothetical protein
MVGVQAKSLGMRDARGRGRERSEETTRDPQMEGRAA